MAAYEWPAYNANQNDPIPGVHNGNGGDWTNIGIFPAMTGALAENVAASFSWWPYDRIAFATRAGVNWNLKWGAFAFQQNEIRESDGVGWPVVHTVTGMQAADDYGRHTGLYQVWGSDGKAYLCGLYAGSTANTTGWVRYDYETGVWTSGVTNHGVATFTGCTSCLAWRGKLYLATERKLYAFDPEEGSLERHSATWTANLSVDKVFVLAGRLFVAAQDVGGNMKINEWLGGGTWYAHPTVWFPLGLGAGGDFAVIQDFERVGLIFYSGKRTLGAPPLDVYFSQFTVEATSEDILSPLTVTDVTAANTTIIFGWTSNPIPLNSAVVIGQQESDHDFGSGSTYAQIMVAGGSSVTSGTPPWARGKQSFRVNPVGNAWAPAGPGTVGSLSYVSSRYGMQDGILNRNERIEPYKVTQDPDLLGALRIHYAAHTAQAMGATMSLRVYYRDPVGGAAGVLGGPHPNTAGSIAASSVGVLNGNGVQVDDVTLTQSGEDHYVVWDRAADLGASQDLDVPFLLLLNNPGDLPAL